ncbi:unnamed protein product [Adineta steineri]|uniref:F-box domain-containing protein n=1 Tax=Adineta steineri TaxID=433720 RepID=A0A815H8Z9_9BILA|nr:unnamed protein product [Adineta steineri]CAF1348625.1 unnamed protein product [Adineta steineri]CAF3708365.1 unnamed protein product [Adineta steineri]CAF3972620.1 unnamed protein product [Adineta steineri]
MGTETRLENLPNEIFLETFDYLHALDIFSAFGSLNKRISSILQLTPLRIIISKIHYRNQVDLLSSYLTFHAHQVISIKINDIIRDDTSIINLLFIRHDFINLKFCKFITVHQSTKLDNVIQQIKTSNKLVSFSITNSADITTNENNIMMNENNITMIENDKYELARIMLMHKSSSLRSIVLQYPYDYSNIFNNISLSSNVTSLYLYINGSASIVSINSILAILRFCHTVRYIALTVEDNTPVNNNDVTNPIVTPSVNENDLPVLSHVISFELTLFVAWNSDSIRYLLHCMHNLKCFIFMFGSYKSKHFLPMDLFDGYVWQELLELYVPYLSKFEFHMSIRKHHPSMDLDMVVNSFKYFVMKYSNWHMIIDQWNILYSTPGEFVMLRTLNFHKHKPDTYTYMPLIPIGSFNTQSTMENIHDHYLFYKNEKDLRVHMTTERPNITCSSPLFQQIEFFTLEISKIPSTWLNNFLDIVNFHETSDDDAEEIVNYLSNWIYLSNLIKIEFGSSFNIYRWKYVQFILQACPNVTNLKILTELLISSKFIDNASLISVFKRIKMIETTFEDVYFPTSFSMKFVDRFPSLAHIELQVISFDNCVSIIDTFLNHLKNLSYLKIDYFEDSPLYDPFPRENIIKKRRQAFPMNIIHEQLINVKNDGEVVEIWLK